jgi:uncharacterized membrane protein YkvA (DUF1232 family)
MRHPAPTPSSPSIPLPRDRLARTHPQSAPVHPDPEAVERFNALVHELYRDAPQVDAEAIASVSLWLESQAPDQRELLLRARLDRLAEIEAMRRDADWPLEAAQQHRIDLILQYVAAEDDLIPDSVPTYGYLDDALLLELAWPVLAEDIDDYRDFCHFREEAGESLGRPPHQLDWLRARAEEGALWEHMHRVHDAAYVDYRNKDREFRVT